MTLKSSFVLPASAAKSLIEDPFGKLTPIARTRGDRHQIRILDTFDEEIARSGRLLIEMPDMLRLIAGGTEPLQQAAPTGEGHVDTLPRGPVRSALGDVSLLRVLLPIGAADMQDTLLSFVDDAEKTRVRARLTWLATSDTQKIALVHLQALRGSQKAHTQLADRVVGLSGTPLDETPLYPSLFPDHTSYTAKPDIVITGDEAAFEAANDIIRSYLPVARENEAGIIADHDIEFLHDYRIALRKIRSVLSLFSGIYPDEITADLKARFSALMARTGRLRDLDVYLAEKDKLFELLPPSQHGGLEHMFALFAQERAGAHAELVSHLESKAYQREVDRLTKLFSGKKKLSKGINAERHAVEYSSALIWKRYRKVCKIAAGIDQHTDDEEVHELRIHCKKLRYLMEFFAQVYPKKALQSVVKPLKRLQDNLGLFNDYSVQQDSLRALLEDLEAHPNPHGIDIAQSVGALILVLNKKQLEERARVVASFATFNDAATIATFRDLFQTKKAAA